MDVTALLNASSSAVDQQKKGTEALKLPTRSRTPWDAGGYSLPLNTAAMKITSPEVDHQEVNHLGEDDSTTVIPFTSTMPTSPIHKFTDSRSSLSSFSSSLHSATHSRYSSISTLNSPRILTSSLPDPLSSPKTGKTSGETSYLRSRDEEEMRARFHHEDSPTKSLDTLAQIAEDHSGDVEASGQEGSDRSFLDRRSEESRPLHPTAQHSTSISSGGSASSSTPNADVWASIEGDMPESRRGKANSVDETGSLQVNDIFRPSSPSDSLLIKRTTAPTLHLDTQDRHLQIPFLSSQHKSHKRAVSAPNFAAMDIHRHQGPMAHEPTPPTSNHPDHSSPQPIFEQSPPDSPPSTAAPANTEPVCMYIDECDTDSPQRKAISHIFGRNKMCTRMIPEHLWVHLCRKHYQRCRYRDQDKWAKAQCDLVQIQIRRIHDWSMANEINGSGIRLQNWTLTMRKREKMRRQKLQEQAVGATKRKRGLSQDDDLDIPDVEGSGYPSTSTKVPDWLVAHCDKEYTTQGILVVFNRLHQDILDGRVGPHFPDLELLPNLMTPEGAQDKKPVKAAVKQTPKKSHQRSQSLHTPATHESSFRDSATKRRRPNEEFSTGGLPALRQARRPTYPSISEHEVSDNIHPRPMYDSLPAPTPQRTSGQSMAAHLEAGDYRGGRPTHSRSQSEFSGFSHNFHSSPELHMSGHYNQIVAPVGGRFDVDYQPRLAREGHSPEYAHGGQMNGREYAMHERNGPMGSRGYQMEETTYGLGSHDHMMGSRRQSLGPRQHSIGPDEYNMVQRQSPLVREAMIGQHESIMSGREMSLGHNRHNSSPAQRSQYYPPQQRHSPAPYNINPHLRESQETRDLYAARR